MRKLFFRISADAFQINILTWLLSFVVVSNFVSKRLADSQLYRAEPQGEGDCGAYQPALPDGTVEAHPADRAAVQSRGSGSLVPRGGCVPGDLAS